MTIFPTKHTCILVLFLLLGIFLINVELTAVNLALPPIANDFRIRISETSGILSFYLAFFAVFTVVGGKLGDLWGRKKLIIITLAVFFVASLLGGSAHLYFLLLISRALQGLSAGAMLPNCTAVLYDNADHEKKSYVIGLVSAVVGLSTSIGPIVGSLISTYFNWRWIFLMNLPICFLIMIGVIFYLKEDGFTFKVSKFDYKGMVFTIFLILTLLQLINVIAVYDYEKMIILFFFTVVLSYLWYTHHVSNHAAFLALHLFHKKTYAMGCFFRALLGFSYYCVLFVLGIFAEEVLHLKSFLSGAMYLPMTLAVSISSYFYGKIYQKIDLGLLLRIGLLLFSIGILFLFIFLGSTQWMVTSLVLLGLAYGILYSVLFSLTLSEINPANTSEASGSLYFFNLFGGSIGVCVAGILLNLSRQNTLEYTIQKGVHYILLNCWMIAFISFIFSLVLLRNIKIQNQPAIK